MAQPQAHVELFGILAQPRIVWPALFRIQPAHEPAKPRNGIVIPSPHGDLSRKPSQGAIS